MECKHCGYEWESKSELKFVSCPSCLKKNENKDHKPVRKRINGGLEWIKQKN